MLRTRPLPVLAIASIALAPLSLSAQSHVTLPLHADAAEGQHGIDLPFGYPGFRTQIVVDAAAIAERGAVLEGIAFRSSRPQVHHPRFDVPNVTVALSYTSVAPGNMSADFARNTRDIPATTVFSGTVQLPPSDVTFAGPQPWDIVIKFPTAFTYTPTDGNLLIEITGHNPRTGGFPARYLDAMQGGGASTEFGVRGDHPQHDALLHSVVPAKCDPRNLSPGNTIRFDSMLTFTSPPGVVAIGIAPQPVPIDLTTIGAPTQSLYVDPLVFVPHNWTQTFIGYSSRFALALPNDPALVGSMLYSQSAVFEPTANALGVVLSAAIETRIGDANERLPMQQLNSPNFAATTGTLVDFSFAGSPEYGSTPVRLIGTFR